MLDGSFEQNVQDEPDDAGEEEPEAHEDELDGAGEDAEEETDAKKDPQDHRPEKGHRLAFGGDCRGSPGRAGV